MAKKTRDSLSVGEIRNFITDFENKHSSLHTRQDSDFDLWRLKEFKLDEFSDNVTSTRPRFYAQAILGQLSSAKLIIKVRRLDGNQEVEAQMEKGFYGWLKKNDEDLIDRLYPPLQSSVAFEATIRGLIAGRTIYDNGAQIFPYDPRHLSWGLDSKGIIRSGYSTWREPYAIEFEYDYKPKKKKDSATGKEISNAVEVIEWIDDKDYKVVVENEAVVDDPHDWGRPPVVLVPVGTMPLIVSVSDKYDYIADWGESVFAPSRSLYEVDNKALSVWFSLLMKSHKPSYFVFTTDGQMKVTGTPWGKGEMLPLPDTARVEQVKPPDIAGSAPQFYQTISSLIQQGDYSSLAYAQPYKTQEPSGKAISNMFAMVEQNKSTLLTAMATFYRTALRKLAEQYTLSSNTETVSGYDSKGERFVSQVTPDLFGAEYDLEVEFKSITPDQEATNYAKAQVAKQGGFVSDKFNRERLYNSKTPLRFPGRFTLKRLKKSIPKLP
jgi:hypothetical protein